ncbi:hypothetical protein KXJ69_08090 [Aureisphaera sp. CAU 1614]|uniref:DUF4440 domain-containing protein n=1 Tax=Halomarinibacterium sedimenti TaxID=2857106 RepID=A0A9X1FPK7_9FLAO|nr:hypothetical protein [Halomarinibacterium sedimenti]MBW2938063.1 hypothetical protein [Halomarinibacterium sedimenti]
MRKIIWQLVLIATLTTGSISCLSAQENNLKDVESEIIEVSEKEINAFKNGDCETLDGFIDENATLYLNGRKAPNKNILIGFCNQIERPFEKPSFVGMEYLPISDSSAYVIRTMEFSKNEKVYKKEIVTKIWFKGSSGWKIVHLHSTITKL